MSTDRVIKFRAWDISNSEMIYQFEIIAANGSPFFEGKPTQYWKLMQYTGRKDDDGTEIFEGDVVKAVACSTYPDQTKTSDVIFNNEDDAQWQVRLPGYNHGLPLTWGGWVSLKVIGNIYQNPELLNSPHD